ncbi:D-alanine--D-alanine ligase [Roseivivax jejudonensis]|uniref:D-alanine--D-alanine ligase n=1 Tax=Roseivivax jejudonensis TaxID=1529041 RepID=A0A1X6YVN3_9RHOB|nr:D-alanine--D-alanine ligase [Roseivivax jejudonensis]SLN32913.1 D-alanine--D-alanine ligase [Roseivivax jejudonensis]
MDVLHLFGSTHDAFYYDLSRMYAETALSPAGTRARYAAVAPDGHWRFGPAPDALGAPMALPAALAEIGRPDLVVPHMFCRRGMTAYRALVEEVLGLPLVGAAAGTAALAQSKTRTRDVVAAAGVRVSAAERLSPGALPGLAPPYVVKPDSEDNSLGISVVHDSAEAAAAVAHARRFDAEVFAEAFVPGREIRVAVVELDGETLVPAFLEYPVSAARPIREVADKLEPGDGEGRAGLRQSRRADAQPVCPAPVDPDLGRALGGAARAAHRALGARHYSLFDFRIHAETGEPHLLEAGLFWSFSALSAISKMLAGAGHDPTEITGRLWRDAAGQSTRPRSVAE